MQELANFEEKVFFGDVILSEAPELRGAPHFPGRGGWPTIRYYNEDTGLEGGDYVKKTEDPVCNELGPYTNYLKEYVMEHIGSTGSTTSADENEEL